MITAKDAIAAVNACDRIELQYIYSPGDGYTRYVVTIDGWQDRTIRTARNVVALCDELNDSAEYCEGCGRYVDSVAQYVPGDHNSAYVCRPCGIAWQETHVWDDAMGAFIETTNGMEA
jgi:hypothetical protein